MDTKDIKATPANPTANAGNPAEDVRSQGAGEDAQMPATPSQLDNLRNMMVNRHAGKQYANDDDIYAQIADDYAAHDNEMNEYKDRESRIQKLFSSDPRSAKFMADWLDGGDPELALIRKYGLDDFKAALDDPDKQEEIAEANKKFIESIAEEKKLTDEYEKNLAQSLEDIDAYQQSHGLSDEQIDGTMSYLIAVARDIIMGKFTPELIDAAVKAQNYDKDVADASHEGEVRGKNNKFDMELRKPSKGDGMPNLGQRSGGAAGKRPNIPGALGREKRSIWDQGGGERRTSHR